MALENNCAIIKTITGKAEQEKYLNYHEKRALMFTFGCLGAEGKNHVHRILSKCMDYDYHITAQHIERTSGLHPLGCKKMFERFESGFGTIPCNCSFDLPDMYPSPVCHAIKEAPGCYVPPKREEQLGHFRPGSAQARINELIGKYAEITQKSAELRSMQSICNEQLDLLFERSEANEMETDIGRLVKTSDGYYLKLGG